MAENPLATWARGFFEECSMAEAASQRDVKGAVAQHLNLGVRDPNLAVRMRSAGFSLDCRKTGNKGVVCKLIFERSEGAKLSA